MFSHLSPETCAVIDHLSNFSSKRLTPEEGEKYFKKSEKTRTAAFNSSLQVSGIIYAAFKNVLFALRPKKVRKVSIPAN